jgi:hypothetical protein
MVARRAINFSGEKVAFLGCGYRRVPHTPSPSITLTAITVPFFSTATRTVIVSATCWIMLALNRLTRSLVGGKSLRLSVYTEQSNSFIRKDEGADSLLEVLVVFH